jgi:hypothetical protein
MTITDGKKLIFKPKRFPYFLELLCNKNKKVEVEEVEVDEVCDECDGEGVCDYGYGEDVRTYACEKCSDGGDEDDLAYDRFRDDQAEAYFEKMNDRD